MDGATTLSIMTSSITTLSKTIQGITLRLSIMTHSIFMLSVGLFIVKLNVFMTSVVMLGALVPLSGSSSRAG
jgi:hypothetical protein